jgi:hypothetical protein
MTTATAKRIADALAARFTAHVEIDERMPGRYGFDVYSKHFETQSHIERQDRAWELVDTLSLSRQEMDDISLLVIIGPEDVDAEVAAAMPDSPEVVAR